MYVEGVISSKYAMFKGEFLEFDSTASNLVQSTSIFHWYIFVFVVKGGEYLWLLPRLPTTPKGEIVVLQSENCEL